jgi:hypothetical protein
MVDPSVSAVFSPAIRSDVPPPLAYTLAQSAGARQIPGREGRNRASTYPGSASMDEEFSRTFDQTILSAWQEQIAVARNQSVKQWCLQQEPEQQPRFAEHYQQLRALRRRVRGVLNANGSALGQGLRCSWHSARRRYLPPRSTPAGRVRWSEPLSLQIMTPTPPDIARRAAARTPLFGKS